MILPAVAGAFLLTSCELEEQIEPAEETYTKAFVKEFGIIDPKQDWNMATRGSVTVNTPSATEVKVYGKTGDNKYRLIGDFGNVLGTKTLDFDITRGVTDIMAEANGKAVFTTVGGSADFSGTRAATRTVLKPSSDAGDLKVTVSDDYTEIPAGAVTACVNGTTGKMPEGNYNLDKVTQNFSFVSSGSFTFYPMYWQSGSFFSIGIYWTDKEGKYHEEDVYVNKMGDELQKLKAASDEEKEYIPASYDDATKLSTNSTVTVDGTEYTISRVQECKYTGAKDNIELGSKVCNNYFIRQFGIRK